MFVISVAEAQTHLGAVLAYLWDLYELSEEPWVNHGGL